MICAVHPTFMKSTSGVNFLYNFCSAKIHRDRSIQFGRWPTSNFFALNLCEKLWRKSETAKIAYEKLIQEGHGEKNDDNVLGILYNNLYLLIGSNKKKIMYLL